MKKTTETIKIIDLFTGIGGLRQGAIQALTNKNFEVEVVFTSEIKKDAVRTLQTNWPEEKVFGDITKIEASSIPAHDLLLAGFPCQAFSFAGNRKGFADTRGTLFFDVLRILKHHRPKYFILENVEGLIKHDPDPTDRKSPTGRTLNTILSELENLNYNVNWRLLNATDFGVPQSRKRIFIVGTLEGKIDFNKISVTKSKGLKSILEKNPKYSLSPNELIFQQKLLLTHKAKDLVGKKIGNKRGGSDNIHSWDFGYHGEVTPDEKKLLDMLITERRKSKYALAHGTPNKDGIALTAADISTFYNGKSPLPSVLNNLTNRGYLTHKDSRYDIAGGKLSFPYSNILDPELNSPTIVASDADRLAVVQGNKLRRLTEKEFKRLFGFSDNFIIPESVSKRAVYDLFGNTVVIPMAKAVTELLPL